MKPESDDTDVTVDDLRQVRPAVDRVRMEEVRASAERGLFHVAEPGRVGRFVLLDTVAAGGMGVVYCAYDPQLDRKVALKVVHPRAVDDRDARERLIGEARALAQLKHPNVVPVYDVLAVDDQIVVVMELVEGQTLAAWEQARARTWREIVAVYVAAGRGLAASHAVGVVHRDFKPSNVIVGDDGRVRVLDFGLARVVDGTETTLPPGAPPPSRDGLTVTGDLVGTLAYMAPEQLAGEVASPASDQFSFCVALHQALFSVRPFAGDRSEELLAAIRAGRLAEPDAARRVPGWLRALVLRGLAAAPAARHASMPRLLDQLDREHGWRRWRWVGLAALLVAIAAAVIASRRPVDPLAACDADDAELDAAWSPARRGVVRAALAAVGTPYAREVADRVLDGLDVYRADWTRMQRDACVAHRRGTQSGALFDRRVLCLQRRKDDLATAVGVLAQADRGSVDRAVDVVAGLPPIAWCADLEALASESDPPATAARAQVAAVRLRLSQAAALERAGRLDDARDLAAGALSEARTLDYPPVVIEAALTEGRVEVARGDLAAAVPVLSLAEGLALEHRQLAAAVVAAARRLYAESMEGAALDGLRREIELLEPLSRGIPGDHFARPLLLNNIGAAHMANRDRAGAVRYFEAARAALVGTTPDLELTVIDRNLAMITADPAVRVPLARAVWARLHDQLGAAHPSTIAALDAYAHYVPDPATSLRLADDACELYARFHPELISVRAESELYRAFLTEEVSGLAAATVRYEEVAALARGATDRDVVSWGNLAAGQASLLHGDAAGARASFTAVIAAFSIDDSFPERLRAAYGHLGAGLAERALGHREEAIAQLEAAAATFAEASALNENLENGRRLALARVNLAAIRNAAGGPRSTPP